MTQAGLKALLETTLNVPCFEAGDSAIYPCSTYEFIDDNATLHGDGEGKVREHNVQVDLWYTERTGRDTAYNLMLAALVSESTTTPDVLLTYDRTACVWRATFNFSTLKEA